MVKLARDNEKYIRTIYVWTEMMNIGDGAKYNMQQKVNNNQMRSCYIKHICGLGLPPITYH